jgi:uncharacterized small protein (DUF1192 family)
MEEQDIEPRTKRPTLQNLDIMSVEALQDMIVELEAEIARIRVAIDGKQLWRRQADTFFKS